MFIRELDTIFVKREEKSQVNEGCYIFILYIKTLEVYNTHHETARRFMHN